MPSRLDKARAQYSKRMEKLAGSPSVIDLVHLGLGPDGHTPSVSPGDPVLQVTGRDVAITGVYQGHKRMTLTYRAINRGRQILWVVTGSEKVKALLLLLADRAAAGENVGVVA